MLSDLVEEFIDDRAAMGVTEKTISWHRQSINRFFRFLEAEGITTLDELSPSVLRRWIVSMQGDGLSPNSVATYSRSVFAFTKWMADESLTESNLQGNVKRPRIPKLTVTPFTDDELARLFNACSDSTYPLRDEAILSLMLDCGLRASEVSGLRLDRVDLTLGVVNVHGKGRVDRSIPISHQAVKALRRYINRERGKSQTPTIFVTHHDSSFTPNGILQIVKRTARRAGVEDANSHKFRHSFALSFIRNGGDSLALQRLLGHSTLEMTRRYVNMGLEDLQSQHTTASPLTNLKRRSRRS